MKTTTILVLNTLILISILIYSFSIRLVEAQEPIYKQGDWVLYKWTASNKTHTCIFWYRVTVNNINKSIVEFTVKLEKAEGPCQVDIGKEFTSRVDIKNRRPEDGGVFIDPSYTGRYNVSGGYIEYYKGVLKHVELLEGDEMLKMELVDTSIRELAPLTKWLISIAVTGGIIVIAIAIILFFLRKTKKWSVKYPYHTPTITST